MCEESENYKWESHVHSLNILKSLFRDSSIGKEIIQFSEQLFLVSIHGFKSFNWSIKNSSLMCFVSLIQKVFGGNFANKLTNFNAKEFFVKFPKLKIFAVSELSNVLGNKRMESIFAILVLLEKLGFENEDFFLQLIKNCALQSENFQIRLKCSKLLISKVIFVDFVSSEVFKMNNLLKENQIHGTLLIAKFFLKRFHNEFKKETKVLEKFIRWTSKLFFIESTDISHNIFLQLLLHIIYISKKKVGIHFGNSFLVSLRSVVVNVLFKPDSFSKVGMNLLGKTAVKLFLLFKFHEKQEVLSIFVSQDSSTLVKLETAMRKVWK